MQLSQLKQGIPLSGCVDSEVFNINLFLCKLALFYRRYQTRKQLAKLSCSQLKDIGISAEEAKAEIGKPFWK